MNKIYFDPWPPMGGSIELDHNHLKPWDVKDPGLGYKDYGNKYEGDTEKPEDEEIWCTECPYFKYVADDMDDSWYGAKCNKDGHESSPSMYAVQSLHDDCPLKRKEGE